MFGVVSSLGLAYLSWRSGQTALAVMFAAAGAAALDNYVNRAPASSSDPTDPYADWPSAYDAPYDGPYAP